MSDEPNKGGAPLGSTNRFNGKLFKAAIMRALEKRTGSRSDCVAALDEIADKLIEGCMKGDIQFLKEFADRMDGKSTQQTEISGPDGAAIPMKTVINFVGTSGS